MRRVLAVIMGGGRGTRLFPLTKDRSKPAVPLGAKYRLVDIPISNCLNSDIKKIYILTQFNTASLHMHINRSFSFDIFSNGYIDILPAEQTLTSEMWYQGTADAVRKNLRHFADPFIDYILILSGDQLYRMNFNSILEYHIEKNAEITVSVLPVEEEKTSGFGILKVNKSGQITNFFEKPTDPKILKDYRVSNWKFFSETTDVHPDKKYLASMGIYVFNRNIIDEVLNNDKTDFGKHIIPDCIKTRNVYAYPFEGYWEDIGTISSFYEANLEMTKKNPKFNFFDPSSPVYTHPRFLPPSRLANCNIVDSIVSEGCIIEGSEIHNSVIGIRSIISQGSSIYDSIIMGMDHLEDSPTDSRGPRGIGKNCTIHRTIIDKNARIGDGTIITSKEGFDNGDFANYYIRDGIVIIPKNAVISPGTMI